MQRANVSRLTGSLSLSAILLGGVATNCDACPDPQPSGRPQPKVAAPGESQPVAECGDAGRYRGLARLFPEECDGTDDQGNPEVFPPGGELQGSPAVLRKCPDGQAYAANEQFHVYWTLCNYADNPPATLLAYALEISTVAGGMETPFAQVPFSQTNLDSCFCETPVVAFNSPGETDPSHLLAPGAYRFRLSGIYAAGQFDPVAFEQVVINP